MTASRLVFLISVLLIPVVKSGESVAPSLPDPPGTKAQKAAEAVIKDLLKADYAAAKKSLPEKTRLGRKLLQLGIEEKTLVERRFVCLREARDLFVAAGDFKGAFEAIDALSGSFKVDALEMKRAALNAVRRSVPRPEKWKEVSKEYPALIAEAVAADRYGTGSSLAEDFLDTAKKAGSEVDLAEAGFRKKDVREIKEEYDRIKDAMAALAKDPGDPEANFSVGRFLALMKDDWERGLPCIAKGSDAAWASRAKKEIEKPASSLDRVDLGDSWWDIAAGEKKDSLKIRIQRRACYWYQMALHEVEGLNRARIEKKLDEFDAAAEKAGMWQVPIFLSDLKEEEVLVGFGVFGKEGKLGYNALGDPRFSETVVNGKLCLKSLSLHAPNNGTSFVSYRLDGKYRMLLANVALVDGDGRPSTTPLIFKVMGDGKVLWTSTPISKPKMVEKCKVRLFGIETLRLEVECPGPHAGAHAIWVDPKVFR
jgi:hypothetical protein